MLSFLVFMATITGGQTGGNEQAATDILRSQGIFNPSSGLIRYVAYGDTGYSQGDAERAGLPLTSGIIQGQRQQAIAPAVASYQASKPEVTQAFTNRQTQLEAEKPALIDRYQNLLADLTGREKKQTTQQANALSTVYGQRGIDLSSGAYQQDLANKLGDITQSYGVQRKDVGLAQEADLRDLSNQITNLTDQRVSALRDIDNRIAELQAGAGNQAVSDALQSYRDDLDRKFQSRFDDLQKKIYEKQTAPDASASPYIKLGEGDTLYDLLNRQGIYTAPKTYKPTGGDNTSDPLGLGL